MVGEIRINVYGTDVVVKGRSTFIIRQILKSFRMRWNPHGRYWFGRYIEAPNASIHVADLLAGLLLKLGYRVVLDGVPLNENDRRWLVHG